jgi:hypothetical protein
MSLPDIDSSRSMVFFFGATEGLAGPLLGGFDDGLVVASRFFGASVAAVRFLFFWAPGVVKKDDMVAAATNLLGVVAVVCLFFGSLSRLICGLLSKFLSGSKKKVSLHRWSKIPTPRRHIQPQRGDADQGSLWGSLIPTAVGGQAGSVCALRLKLQVRVPSCLKVQ